MSEQVITTLSVTITSLVQAIHTPQPVQIVLSKVIVLSPDHFVLSSLPQPSYVPSDTSYLFWGFVTHGRRGQGRKACFVGYVSITNGHIRGSYSEIEFLHLAKKLYARGLFDEEDKRGLKISYYPPETWSVQIAEDS